MGGFSLIWGQQPQSVERDSSGNWSYEIISPTANNRSRFVSEFIKLNTILNSPACLKVLSLNCDLFSLGKINSEKDVDILYNIAKRPNPKQTWTQFMWDYMFWLQTGTAYLWNPSGKILNDNTGIQWLNPAYIVWDTSLLQKLQGLIFSQSTFKDVLKGTLSYNLPNGQSKQIPLSEITPFFDLTNGVSGNFYKGASRIDALYKIIINAESGLDAKNINLEYSQKFMASQKSESLTDVNMSEDEKQSIEGSIRSAKTLHAIKKPVEIKRFVDDIGKLQLDPQYLSDVYSIGNMFGIPKDILEASLNGKGSTYENQEKSMGRHTEYVMKPKGQMLTDEFKSIFSNVPQDAFMSWQHLAFNQVFELDRQAVITAKLTNAILAKTNNINIDTL